MNQCFGVILQKLRGLSADFATNSEAARAVGLTPTSFARILRAERGVSLDTARSLQKVFGTDAVTIRRNKSC